MATEESSGISPPPGSFNTGWLNWDLKALTQEWVDGVTANNGVILISAVQDEQVIDSKEKGGSTIPQLVIILADYQYKNAFVADREVNMVACLTEIMLEVNFK